MLATLQTLKLNGIACLPTWRFTARLQCSSESTLQPSPLGPCAGQGSRPAAAAGAGRAVGKLREAFEDKSGAAGRASGPKPSDEAAQLPRAGQGAPAEDEQGAAAQEVMEPAPEAEPKSAQASQLLSWHFADSESVLTIQGCSLRSAAHH
jgi:hypothetical protein